MRRILILEQDPETQCVLGRFLARHGYAIAYASDGNDAASEARKSAYDLLLLDIAEGDDGAAGAFLRSLRGDARGAAVLLLTSSPPGASAPPPAGVRATVNKRARNFFDELLDQVNAALSPSGNPDKAPGR
jgi:CheY-like chemotaxis protein